jgi:hypothetical protein
VVFSMILAVKCYTDCHQSSSGKMPPKLWVTLLAFPPPQLLTRELAEDGYAGVEVRVTALMTEIIIRATRVQNVLGEKGQRIRELTSVIQKR